MPGPVTIPHEWRIDPIKEAVANTTPAEIEAAYKRNEFDAWRPEFVRKVNTPTLSQAAPWVLDEPDRDTFLWRFLDVCLREQHGANYGWLPQYQLNGTCVGQGFKLAVDILMAVNAVLGLSPWKGRAAVAPIYGGSRVEVGGMPGRWDGSNGSWASKWLIDWGVVLLSEMDLPDDSRREDEVIAVNWAASRSGVPAEVEDIAQDKPVTRRVLITKARECGKFIQTGNPVVECSNLIASGRRDADGFSRVSRSGGHCQAFTAVRYNPFGLWQQNSWSEDWGSGGEYTKDQPPGGVWVNERDADAQLSQGDSYGLVGLSGLGPADSIIL